MTTTYQIPDDPNYRLTLIAYRSAIAFTDIDTDMTTEDFPDWWQAKTGIVIPDEWWPALMNDTITFPK